MNLPHLASSHRLPSDEINERKILTDVPIKLQHVIDPMAFQAQIHDLSPSATPPLYPLVNLNTLITLPYSRVAELSLPDLNSSTPRELALLQLNSELSAIKLVTVIGNDHRYWGINVPHSAASIYFEPKHSTRRPYAEMIGAHEHLGSVHSSGRLKVRISCDN